MVVALSSQWMLRKGLVRAAPAWVLQKLPEVWGEQRESDGQLCCYSVSLALSPKLLLPVVVWDFFGHCACQSCILVWLLIPQLCNSSLCEKQEVVAVVAEKHTARFSFSSICWYLPELNFPLSQSPHSGLKERIYPDESPEKTEVQDTVSTKQSITTASPFMGPLKSCWFSTLYRWSIHKFCFGK